MIYTNLVTENNALLLSESGEELIFLGQSDYNDWLSDSASNRCLLVVLKGFNQATQLKETFYFSSHAYATHPTDTPASWQFESRLSGDPSTTRSIPFFGEKGDYKEGDIELTNNDGRFDAWINYSFAGRSINKYLGDPSWAFSDFTAVPLFTGIIEEQPDISIEKVALKVRDKMGIIDAPIQINTIVTGETNEPVPLSYGYVRNVTPRLIDTATHKYQVHDGVIQAILAVYDNGLPVDSFTPNLSAGTFVLGKAPAGTITCDVQGAKPSGTHLNTAALIINDILTRVGDPLNRLTANDIDSTTLNALPSYLIGLYISDRQNKLNVLEQICASMRAAFTFNRNGKFQVKRIVNPATLTPIFTVTDFHIKEGSLKISAANIPQFKTTLGYQKNHTVQKNLQTAITEATRTFLKEEFRTSVAEDSTVKNWCLNASNPKTLETCLDVLTDANTESTAIQAILGKQCYFIEFELARQFYLFELGDAIVVQFEQFQLQSGKNAQILSITEHELDLTVQIKAWFYV